MKRTVFASLALFAGSSCAHAQDDPWFSALEGKSTAEMGALMLEGQQHGPIVEIADRTEGMTPPGSRDYTVIERPERQGDACLRTAWNVNLIVGGDRIAPNTAYARRQVALSPDDPCEFASYATVSDDIAVEEAVAMHRLVREFETSGRAFSCRDETQSDLCRTESYTRMNIRYMTLNRIRREDDGAFTLWLGEQFTEIVVPADDSEPLAITRRVPAPF